MASITRRGTQMIDHIGTAAYHDRTTPQCNAHLDPKVVYAKKQRKNGTWYNIRAIVGERCPEPAIISRNGVHRCFNHRMTDE